MAAQFVHLHLHTHYSLLDGAIRIPDLIKRAGELGFGHLAMTDHGNLHGAVDFFTSCHKAGINPIIGCEVYVAPADRRDKDPRPDGQNYYHLVLLSENEAGYQNLLKIVSDAYINGFYYRPRTDLEFLAGHAQGLIALSACLQGQVPVTLSRFGEAEARAAAGKLGDIFGRGNFFIEIQDAGLPEQAAVNPGLMKLAQNLSLPLVATNDCHYLNREDALAHEVLLAVQTGKQLEDLDRLRLETDQLYVRPAEEMIHLFRFQPELIKNTLAIAERCRLTLRLDEHHFPEYPLPEGQTAEEILRQKAAQGLQARLASRDLPPAKARAYQDRLLSEIEVILEMGFAGYFLVVADFINWAKDQGIPVGPGRGSAAGSLTAFALGITDLDPIPYQLLFERFLNIERISMPDIDVDFCFLNRDKVINYVTERYGHDKVAQITTFGTLQAKAVIRDVGRALGLPYGEVDRIAKLVPNVLGITLAKAQEHEPRLRELRQADPKVDNLLRIAERLEGLHRHASTHAAGVVIADKPLTEYLPVYQDPKTGKTVTQFDMKSVEKAGLIKFDFLGLRTLTVIETAGRLVREGLQPGFDIRRVPLTDPETFALLSRGDTTGVFQLESSGMKDLLVKLKPSTFEDIIALVALYRPGPMDLIPDFIERKHGRVAVTHPHPSLAPILKDTYGIIVYQEQVMAIANVLSGYSLGQADILRRAMGKKSVEVMEQERVKFIEGARAKGVEAGLAEDIFDLIAKFAGYGFNKSHAAAYALIAYQTAYLKAHFPVQFMAAQLTSWAGDSDHVTVLMAECRTMKVKVLPPDVNASPKDFGVDGGAIRFGLAAVKNLGEAAVEAILEARAGGPFTDLFDFCERVDLRRVNRRVVESLIKCGAFDFAGGNRAQLMAVLGEATDSGQRRQKERDQGQFNLFEAAEVKAGEAFRLPDVDDWPRPVRLGYEKEALGFYVSGHPLEGALEDLKRFADANICDLKGFSEGQVVKAGGLIASRKEITTKKGERMAFLGLEDLTGRVEVVCLPQVFAECRSLLESEEPVLVLGLVNQAEEGAVTLKAKEIIPLAQAGQKYLKEVSLVLDCQRHTPENLVALKKIFSRHPGQTPVVLRLISAGRFEAVLRAGERYRVSPTPEFFSQVGELLGPNGRS